MVTSTIFGTLLIVLFSVIVGVATSYVPHVIPFLLYKKKKQTESLTYIKPTPFGHNVSISGATRKIYETFSGLQPWVGPSPASWPVAYPQKWEVTTYEDDKYFYARLIFHEYVLWMSFDFPYMLVKINKKNIPSGYDISKRDDQLRLCWNWTYQNLHQYDCYTDLGFASPKLESINGHTVTFNCDGGDTYSYEKYLLLSDENDPW